MLSGRTNNFPRKWALPRSRDPIIFGSTVGYPSDSLASCITFSLHSITNTVVVFCVAIYTYLAIDVRRQKLYYADMANNGTEIGELSTNGGGRRVLVNITDYQPGAIVLDDKNRCASLPYELNKKHIYTVSTSRCIGIITDYRLSETFPLMKIDNMRRRGR